jgi:hypothetical protein
LEIFNFLSFKCPFLLNRLAIVLKFILSTNINTYLNFYWKASFFDLYKSTAIENSLCAQAEFGIAVREMYTSLNFFESIQLLGSFATSLNTAPD